MIHCDKRKEQREPWYQAILKYTTDTGTYPPLQDLLMNAMRALMDDSDLTQLAIPEEVANVACAQAGIGWEHLLKGRFSKEWTKAQDRHAGSQDPTKSGQTWLTGLVQTMLQQWFNLWEVRNQDLHGHDAQSRADALKRQAIREITLIYEKYKGNIRPEDDANVFNKDLNQRTQMTTTAMRMWINSWSAHLEESYQTQLETG